LASKTVFLGLQISDKAGSLAANGPEWGFSRIQVDAIQAGRLRGELNPWDEATDMPMWLLIIG